MLNETKTHEDIKRQMFGLDANSLRPIVCVQGLGFVGAAMSIAVASATQAGGHSAFDVIGVDLDNPQGNQRVQAINAGLFPFSSGDNSLEKATRECHEKGNLSATTDNNAFRLADIVIVDVNLDVDFTKDPPIAAFDSYLLAIEALAMHIKQSALVIVETTVPPGTCEHVVLPTLQKAFKHRGLDPENILLAHSYERVMPGPEYLNSIINFWRVFAAVNETAADACEAFLCKVIDTKTFPLRKLSSMTASETAKIMENTYRAVNIALMDEWGSFAEASGIDIFEIINAIRDRPTHSNMRQPGFGVGGYCLTKDPYFGQIANIAFSSDKNVTFPFAQLAMQTNQKMPVRNLDRIQTLLNKAPEDTQIILMGVAYRSEVDDTRYSAAEIFYKEALSRGMSVTVHDPHVQHWQEMDLDVGPELPSPNNADAVVFCVPHRFYQQFDLEEWLGAARPMIYDCDNVLTKMQQQKINAGGLKLASTGRG